MNTVSASFLSFVVICLFALVILPFGKARADTCYTVVEAEAEQAIRIHSELMVIGLNCQHMTPQGWKNFYTQYKEFTNKHSNLFEKYEKTLVSYFRDKGRSDPERELHGLRTNLANKVSNDAAQMRPDIFCATYAPRLPQAAAMSEDQVVEWASTFHGTHPVSQPICK